MKKTVLFFFSIFLPYIAMAAITDYDVKINGIYYKLSNIRKTATVVCGPATLNFNGEDILTSCYSGDVKIPESFKYEGSTYTVNSIEGYSYSTFGGVLSLGAFEKADITSVTIPPSITEVGEQAFHGCGKLNAVYISDMEAWCKINFRNNPLIYAHNLYLNNKKVSDLTIPESITEIKRWTFYGCHLSSVIFHRNITKINEGAFWECGGWKDVYSYSPKIELGGSLFPDDLGSVTLHVRERFKDNYTGSWSNFGKVEYLEGTDFHLKYIIDNIENKNIWYEFGEVITPEPEPTKEGYSFSGWSEIPETMPSHDVIVTGSFSINKYELTYIVDRQKYKSFDVEYNFAIIPEANPIKKGMTFSGWSEIPETMPSHAVTVTGTFSWSKLTKDNVIYEVADTLNNYCRVIANNNASGEIMIDAVVIDGCNYYPMEIADKAFYGCKDITKIEIPKMVHAIGERAFANIDKLTDVTVLSEEIPTTDRTAFENSYVDYVTLHVPASSVNKYKSTAPWSGFKVIVSIEDTEPQEKCATPTIDYKDGKLVFECETDGAECVTTITSADVDTHYGNEVEISYTYNICTYAKADGYANSEVVTAMLVWIEKDETTTALNEEIEAKAILVQAHEGSIWISGAEPGTLIEVFDIGGTRIAIVDTVQGTTQIATSLKAGDIAIVKIGMRTVKVVMR